VLLVETHISWVLLAGRYAYKIKKALDLGFLNYTSLEARKFYCFEEVRLNSRLAPGVYLDVIPIGGKPDTPGFGAQPVIEYAVKMRRFATAKEFDHLLARGKIMPRHMDELAARLAIFHGGLPRAQEDSAFGAPATILAAAIQNFEALLSLLTAQNDGHDKCDTPDDETCLARFPLSSSLDETTSYSTKLQNTAAKSLVISQVGERDKVSLREFHVIGDAVEELRRSTGNAYTACEKYFIRRRVQGCVRECHGNLHLGNIVLIGKHPVPFDGIEFNPALRWIDVMDEVAFLVMDLMYGRRPDLAFRFLNAYLEATGDYAGVSVLRFYMAYRAGVRAKVSAIRASQPDHGQPMQTQALTACRNYLALAAECLAPQRPALLITHGLPGSGKSTFAQIALERLQAIRIRSDVERKRLFGISPLDDSRTRSNERIYSADATRRTYSRLYELARDLLNAGFPVIVDAAFLKQDEREQFHALALSMSVPFAIMSIQASSATLGVRITQRRYAAIDASEADLGVLHLLQAAQQPLLPHELLRTVVFLNDADQSCNPAEAASWDSLDKLLGASQR